MPTQTFFDLKKEKQQRIIHAACRIFTKIPYEKVSIQDIVNEAEIPRGSFYQYFLDKEDLYLYLSRVVLSQNIGITYRDNMDYFWKVLYNEVPDKSFTIWEQAAVDTLRGSMHEDEFHFMMDRPDTPMSLTLAELAQADTILYPYLQKHMSSDGIISNPIRREQLAYLFSQVGHLEYEYSLLKDIPLIEAAQFVFAMMRSIYESCQEEETKNADKMRRISSIHLISPSGLDLTLSLSSKEGIRRDITDGSVNLEAAIAVGSLNGHLPAMDAGAAVSAPEAASLLTLTFREGQLTLSTLQYQGISYTLGTNLTVIGNSFEDEHLCIADAGKLLI